MVRTLRLLKNVGKFDNVTSGAALPFEKVTVIYAENARGKTTIASIMRSLSTGEPGHIAERQRLGVQASPHVVIELAPGTNAVFQQNAWSQSHPNLLVFDDAFVAANVCSGIEVDPSHRQNLHELIVGQKGVTLNRDVQTYSAQVDQCNRDIRERSIAIPANRRGGLSVDDFCSLPQTPDLPDLLAVASRQLAAAKDAVNIAAAADFSPVYLPIIDLDAVAELLAHSLDDIDAAALARVTSHLKCLGGAGERWVGAGVGFADGAEGEAKGRCPFCAQPLTNSEIFPHYRAYFGESYKALQKSIVDTITSFESAHRADVQTGFERGVRLASERHSFWKQFVDVPEFHLDTAAIGLDWKAAREPISAMLIAKRAAPLDRHEIPQEVRAAVTKHNANLEAVTAFNEAVSVANAFVATVKEQARTANFATIEAELLTLRTKEARYEAATAQLCDAYIAAQQAKAAAEQARDAARAALEAHRKGLFPGFATAINAYLQRFNASFRIANVAAANIKGGSAANYALEIDGKPVPLNGNPGEPAFRNTLSAGDRNTLALAFFFASIDASPQKAQMTVVIDDPMTSLDEHRNLHTIQEIERLARDTSGVVILSHSKPFLFGVWDKCRNLPRTAIEVRRNGQGSTLAPWNVNDAMICEHDRRFARAVEYLVNGGDPAMQRTVAESLRPMLENYARVAYSGDFKPGDFLGNFVNTCGQRVGTAMPLMDAASVAEFRALLDFGNRYHHDTNAGYATELINDAELVDFTRRTLRFMQRP